MQLQELHTLLCVTNSQLVYFLTLNEYTCSLVQKVNNEETTIV